MGKETYKVELEDNLGSNLKDNLRIGGPELKGHVEIYEKMKNGSQKLLDKQNLIVYSGREWLLDKAFGGLIDNNETTQYDASRVIKWFGAGTGGGEAGNPLQAGATVGSDSDLRQPVRLRDDLTGADLGYPLYGTREVSSTLYHGYFKQIQMVSKREDHANPYVVDGETVYPMLIAEARIELSSDDGNGSLYEDLNEAGLYISIHDDVTDIDPGDPPNPYPGYGETISTDGPWDVVSVVRDEASYNTQYNLDSDDPADFPNANIGDLIYATGTSTNNLISVDNPLRIVDIFKGEIGLNNAYIVVEKTDGEDETLASTGDIVVNHVNQAFVPYILFARVTFSTIRKTPDRELVFLWKIYF